MSLQPNATRNPNMTVRYKLTRVLFIIYLLLLCWILLFKLGVRFSYMEQRKVNLVPFAAVDTTESILNILVFIPLGIYAGILFMQWNFLQKLLFFISCSVALEVLQFVFAIGAFDSTDIITNSIGATTGWIIYKLITMAFSNHDKAHKFINVVMAAGTLLLITLLILLKLQMLPIRYQ